MIPAPTLHNILHPSCPRVGHIGFVRPNVGAIPPMAEMQVMWWLAYNKNNLKNQNQKSCNSVCHDTMAKCMASSDSHESPPRSWPSSCPHSSIVKHDSMTGCIQDADLDSKDLHSEGVTPTFNRFGYRLLGQHPRTGGYGVDYGIYMHKLAQEIGAAPCLVDIYRAGGVKPLIAYCLGQAYIPWFRVIGPFANKTCVEVAKTELWRTVAQRGWVGNGLLTMITLLVGPIHAFCYVVALALGSLSAFLGSRTAVKYANKCFSLSNNAKL